MDVFLFYDLSVTGFIKKYKVYKNGMKYWDNTLRIPPSNSNYLLIILQVQFIETYYVGLIWYTESL